MRTKKVEICSCIMHNCKSKGVATRIYEGAERIAYMPPKGMYFYGPADCADFICEKCAMDPTIDFGPF